MIHNVCLGFHVYASGSGSLSVPSADAQWHWSLRLASDPTTARRPVWEPRLGCCSRAVCYAIQCQWVTLSFARPAGLWSVEFECCNLQQHCSTLSTRQSPHSALESVPQWSDWTQCSRLSVTVEIWRMCIHALSLFSNVVLIIGCKYITYNLYSTTI